MESRITGPAFAGYTDQDIREVRQTALELLIDAPTVEDSHRLQESIDACNSELGKREAL